MLDRPDDGHDQHELGQDAHDQVHDVRGVHPALEGGEVARRIAALFVLAHTDVRAVAVVVRVPVVGAPLDLGPKVLADGAGEPRQGGKAVEAAGGAGAGWAGRLARTPGRRSARGPGRGRRSWRSRCSCRRAGCRGSSRRCTRSAGCSSSRSTSCGAVCQPSARSPCARARKFQATRTLQHRRRLLDAFVLVRVGQERPLPRAFGARHNVFFGGVEMAPCSYNTTALYDSTKFAVTPYNSHSATLLTNKVDSITIQYSGSLFPGGINVTARRPSSCQRSSAPR